MKKLLFLVLLLAVIGGALFRQSVYYALFRLSAALQEGDVATVEQHADLAALAKAPAHLAAAITEEVGRRAGGDLVGAIAGAVVSTLGADLAGADVQELRRGIARGDFAQNIGAFRFEGGGFPMVPPVQAFQRTALVEVRGTCEGAPATVVFVFERQDDGPALGYPSTWRATGVDRSSLVALAKSCAAGASQRGGAPAAVPPPAR